MTDTLNEMAASEEELEQEELAQQLLAQAKQQGVGAGRPGRVVEPAHGSSRTWSGARSGSASGDSCAW